MRLLNVGFNSLLKFQKTANCNVNCCNALQRQFHTTNVKHLFFEPDKTGGYDTKLKTEPKTLKEYFITGITELKKEIKIWKNEVNEKINGEALMYYQPGIIDNVFDFTDPETLKKFKTSSDNDFNEGFSKCSLVRSKAGRALFSGYLDTRIPKDGRVTKAGYCAMRSDRYMKSFKRDSFYDWTNYNTFVLKVRGDGRPYLINLSIEGKWDLSWNDIYNYVLYTRGGPYWQIAKIPFSKFIFSSKGRIQDNQYQLDLTKVTHVGLACGDRIDGPFSLEIEYIGVENDPDHNEEFAYEMYKTDKWLN